MKKRKIKNFYSTRELVERVSRMLDRTEESVFGRICFINNKHQLQIRGKHLRRLMKHMPNLYQKGSTLKEKLK